MIDSTSLADGGRVDATYAGVGATVYLQKYDASGAPVGPQTAADSSGPFRIEPLSDGGYVFVGVYYPAYAGESLNGVVFDPEGLPGTRLGSFGGFQLEASPLGGFLVTAQQVIGGHPPNYVPPRDSTITLYDNAGHKVIDAAVPAYGRVPTLSLDGSGVFTVSWNDGSRNHLVTIDPTHPPDLAPPAQASVVGFDDVGAPAQFTAGAINDPTPTFRVSVSEVGYLGFDLERFGGTKSYDIPVTPDDVARGYVLVNAGPLLDGQFTFFTRQEDATGVASPEATLTFTVDTHAPDLTIVSARDDAGAEQGDLSTGARTDDAAPTLKIALGAATQAGDTVSLACGGAPIAGTAHTVTSEDLSLGYVLITPQLSPAAAETTYHFTALGADGAGNSSASNTFDLTLVSGSGGPGDTGQVYESQGPQSAATGGGGNDTFYASQGLDTLTGGGGADLFVFRTEPWAPDHITDFVVGQDRLDLSALFQAAGYAGADPQADGFIYLESDGAGGTLVRFDRDGGGPNPQWPNSIIDLEHLSPTGLTWSQLAGAAPPSDGGGDTTSGGAGQVFTSAQPGTVATGGAGADTFVASQGLDTLTGAGGADLFVLKTEPWAPIHITDFAVGADKLDLSALFQAAGYAGADPQADGYIYLESDGAGGTVVRFDHDGGGPNPQWPNTIVDLEHVAPAGLSWAQLSGGGGGGGDTTPGGSAGLALVSPGPGSTLAGGDGADTLTASAGLDTLTGGGGTDVFAFPTEPWAPIHVTDFTPGTDKLDLSALFRAAGYAGSDPIGDGYVFVESDGAGGAVIRFDHDGGGPNPQWPNTIIDLEHIAPGQVSASEWIV